MHNAQFVLVAVNGNNWSDLEKEIYLDDYYCRTRSVIEFVNQQELDVQQVTFCSKLYTKIFSLLDEKLAKEEIAYQLVDVAQTKVLREIYASKEDLRLELEDVFNQGPEELNQCLDRQCVNYYLNVIYMTCYTLQ